MSEYHAPVKEMLFALRDLGNLAAVNRLPVFADATPDLVEAVLEEAAQLATEVIAPTNVIGDTQGSRVENDEVVVPGEFKAAYDQFVESGWCGIAQSEDYGGQGLPYLVGLATQEMWKSANMAWSLCPLLTTGAAHAIESHGDQALREKYLPNMISGKWTGTMNLTEPQAGSDLAAVRSQAVPEGDHYRVTGQKIFITWGDHNMTENVIHLVLARLPDAPEGSRGLSLFLVPKYLVNDDGLAAERNGVKPVSVEHKLGIHGSPTCVMAFDDAIGYIVGKPHHGLAHMFTMMNHARLGVGLEGVSISERAYQQAREYAIERIQGQMPGVKGRVSIIHHPDVRRMLMTMKCQIEAMRAVVYMTGAALDLAHGAEDEAERQKYQARVDLLTPVVKGWATETGQNLTSLALQVHGGMGYVEETGVAQHFRDARITTIYEGTTGIQAGDFVGRKLLRDGGQSLQVFLADVQETCVELERHGDSLATIRSALLDGCTALVASAETLMAQFQKDPAMPGAISFNLLMLMGVLTGGWQMARSAIVASDLIAEGRDKEFHEAKVITARFYAEHIMPGIGAYKKAIESGGELVMALKEDQF